MKVQHNGQNWEKTMDKVQQCKGDFAYRLAYDNNELPESHIGDTEEENQAAVNHYLNHIQEANNTHPLKSFNTDTLISVFNDLYNKGHLDMISNTYLFAEYMIIYQSGSN